jgi:predicted RNA-binding Zn ribbon-like protein
MIEPRLVGGHVALDLVNTVAPRAAGDRVEYLGTPADLLRWARRVDLVTVAEADEVEAAWAGSPTGAGRALEAAIDIREATYGVLTAALQAAASASAANDSASAANYSDGAASDSAEGDSAEGDSAEGDRAEADRAVSDSAESGAAGALTRLAQCWAAAAARSVLVLGSPPGPAAVLSAGRPGGLLVPDRLAHAAVDLVRTIDLAQLRVCPVAEGGCGWLFLDRSRNGSRRWCAMEDCGTQAKSRRLTERRRARR